MHELYEIKEMLMDELKEYGEKGKMSSGDLEVVDKLTHAIKNVCKIIEGYEDEEYSSRGNSYRGGMYNDMRVRRNSYARRRDAMGRYSRDEGMVAELRDLMEDAPNEKTRMEFERFIKKIEQM